eukprot:jgi/Mesen1/4011/ME000211S03194
MGEKVMEMDIREAPFWEYRGEGAANIVLSYSGATPSLIGKVLRIRKIEPKKPSPPPVKPSPPAQAADSGAASTLPGAFHEEDDYPADLDGHHPNLEPVPEPGQVRTQPLPLLPSNSSGGAAEKVPPVLSEAEQYVWSDYDELVRAATKAELSHVYIWRVMSPLLGPGFVDPGAVVTLSREFVEAVDTSTRAHRPAWRVAEGHLALAAGHALVISDHSLFPHPPGPPPGARGSPSL